MIILIIAGILYFNKDKIVKKAVEEIELATGTDIDYESTSIGIDGSFPNIRVSVNDLRVRKSQDTITLVELESISATANPLQIIRNSERIELSEIVLINPFINLIKDQNGEANWDFITKEKDQEKSSNKGFSFNKITVKDGKLSFLDRQSDLSLLLHKFSYNGEMVIDQNDLKQEGNSEFNILIKSQDYDDVKYKVGLELISNYNTATNNLSVENSDLIINALQLNLDGRIGQTTEGVDYRLNIESKDQEFSNLLSLLENLNNIPKVDLNASGQFSVNGYLSGQMNSKSPYPIYALNIDAKDGRFYLPTDPSHVLEIDLNTHLRNKDHTTPFTELSMSRLSLKRDHEKVEGAIFLDRFENSLSVSFDIDAKIDDIKNFDDLVDYDLNGGKVHLLSTGDFVIDEKGSGYTDAEFKVDWEAENIDFIMDSLRVYSSVSEGLGDERSVTINFGKTNYGSSDLRGDMVIKKPLEYLKDDPSLLLSLNIKSEYINLNELLNDNGTSSNQNEDLSWINAKINLQAKKIQYREIPISDFTLDSHLEEDRFMINNSIGEIEESDFKAMGQLNNLSSYLNDKGALIGTLDFDSKELDLDRLEELYYDTTFILQDSTASVAFENLDIKIISSSNSLNYYNTHIYENLASLNLRDNRLIITDFISSSFGGKLNVKGDITFGRDKSNVELKTNFENISIAESLESLPFFKKLSYPLTFIDGRINTTLSLATGLDNNYNFIYPELNAFALLETLDGKITDFKPLEKLNSFLGLHDRADLVIKQSKNWITIQDGWVQIEEFVFSINDYHFKVKGAHSLENNLNYTILAEVPSAKISKINLEEHISPDLIAKLNKYRSAQKGYVGLLFEMKGTFNTPTIKLNEIDMISAGKALVKQTIQDAKDSIRTKIDTIRTDIENDVRDTLDVFLDNGEEKIETILDSAQVKFEEEMKSKLDSTILNQIDSIGGNIIKDNKTLDSLKDQIFKLKGIFV